MRFINIEQTLIIFLLIIGLGSETARAQEQPGVFYSVTGKDLKDSSWLYGTYHLVPGSYLEEIPLVKRAFQKAGHLVVETVLDSAAMQQSMVHGVMREHTLSQLIDSASFNELDKVLKQFTGQGIDRFQSLKPMAIMLMLSMQALLEQGNTRLSRYHGLPLDAYFAAEQQKAGKTLTPLETVEHQSRLLFNTLTEQAQADLLKNYLANRKEQETLGLQLLNDYFQHDLGKLEALSTKMSAVTGPMDHLLEKRNHQWMQKLPEIMRGESGFIAVGALHLAGDNGLIALLRKAGYNVTAQKVKP